MEDYNYKNLIQQLGEKIKLQDGEGNQAELTIAEVNKGVLDDEDWEAFSVIYSGVKGTAIPQGIYTFSHQSFGEQQLFLSQNSDTEYETVVTRKRLAEA